MSRTEGRSKVPGSVAALAELLGESPGIMAVREQIARLLERPLDARRLPPILIQGETGTGKGLVARAIHRAGLRAAGPFVDVNCAAIPETLLEAELFGFERGAFTDARQAKAGLFQAAHRGTLFLDEIGLLPEGLQGKLLTVLEERSVRRLGSTRGEPVDVWVLAATGADLEGATRARRFREDLYHRLAVLRVWLPPLRERGRDILLLAEHFLARACGDYNLPPKTLAPDAQAALMAYGWPGNIRELANVLERVALLAEGLLVTAAMLGLPAAPRGEGRQAIREEKGVPLKEAVGSVEREHLLGVLGQTDWNITRAAALLGISRNTLRYRIEKYGLRPGKAPPAPGRPVERPPAEAPRIPAAGVGEGPAPAGIRWERRRLSLLRVALIGEPLRDTSRALEEIIEKVRSFGGRVEELSPTGIVAAFGIEPVEDAPRRAALAALATLKAAERARRAEAEQVAGKIAIHVGQFLVGQVNGATQIDLDAKREAGTVLEALVERAEPDTILVSAVAAPFLERRFELVLVESLERPIGPAYRLSGPERTGLGLGRRISDFVGRQQELELLQSRFISAMRGHGQVVGIAGEAGIGKSRFLYEFRQSLLGAQVTYLEGRCFSYGSTIAYFPVLDIVRMSCEITEADSPETIAEKVSASLNELGMDPAAAAPYLLHLLGIKEGTNRLAALQPEVIKARTFEALRQMCLRLSGQRPVVIVVEDLHWIDTTSEEYFASLVESIAGARILLIFTYRPGYLPAWIGKSYAAQIALQPLAPQESLSIVRSVLGTEEVPEPLAQMILSKAEGNPFFLEELARAAREQGGASPTLAVPDTVEEVLLVRIDRLPPEEKLLLQSAAIIGKDVPFSPLQAITGLPDDTLRRSLMNLQAAEFLYETSLVPEPEYTFKHILTQEVAYESLLQERRHTLHARIVEAVERLYPDRLAEQIERLAHHAFHGEVWDKALTYLRQAGAKAASRSAYREAVAYFEQALVALSHLPESRETFEQAIDLRFELRTALTPLGEHERISSYLKEAKTLAEVLGDQPRLGRVSAYDSDCFRLMGDHERAIESGQRALALTEALGDFTLQVMANTYLGLVYYHRGDYRRAVDFFRRIVESLVGDLVHKRFGLPQLPSVHSRAWLVSCLAELGDFIESIAKAEEGVRIAESVDQPLGVAVAYLGVGQVYLRKGDFHKAIPVLERGLELSRDWNTQLLLPNVAAALGSGYVLAGHVQQAIPLLEDAVERSASMRKMGLHSIRVASLSEAYLLAGRVNEALELAQQALDLSRDHKERGCEAWVLRLLGEIALRSSPFAADQAADYYHQAMALANELGMCPLIAHCHLGLGKLYRRTGNYTKAVEHMSAANALFQGMEMRFWLEQCETELKGFP